jgi:hypothetical protein
MALSTQYQGDSDISFTGFSSRINPLALKPGFLQYAENLRLFATTARCRLGAKRITDTTLNSWITWGAGEFIDANGVERVVIVATSGGTQTAFFVYTPAVAGGTGTTQGPFDWPTQSGQNRVTNEPVSLVQAGGEMYVFRGRDTDTAFAIQTATHSNPLNRITCVCYDPHGLVTGDEVTVYGASGSNYNGNFKVTVSSPDTFYYTPVALPSPSSQSDILGIKSKPPIKWDGVTYSNAGVSAVPQTTISGGSANMPPGDFGIYHQGRLLIDYRKDRIAVSDIFDEEIYDLTLNNFRVNTGANDEIISFLPWISDGFLVLQKRSIYLGYMDNSVLTPGSAPGVESYVRLLSDQIGCLAKDSAVVAGQQVFFLSQRGVHVMTPQLDLTLVGNTLPMSEPIADIIESINFDYADKAVAAFHDNRYWLAVPTGLNTRNDTLLVYNILNEAWESADKFPPGLYVDHLLALPYDTQRRLHFMTKEGGLFVHEEEAAGDNIYSSVDLPILPVNLPFDLVPAALTTVAVTATARTRSYSMSSLESKRFSKVSIKTGGSGTMTVTANTQDPDVSEVLGSFTLSSETDTNRIRVASKGQSIDFTMTLTGGEPEIRAIAVAALPNSFQTKSS